MATEAISPLVKLFGSTLKGQKGDVPVSSLAELDAVGVYFSAHWCPPCRGFTPKLAAFYEKMKDAGKKFEIVFVSSDRDQGAFDEYFTEMPWMAMPYNERKRKAKLSKKFGVSGIPSFQIISPTTGRVTNEDGRAIVGSDPEGENFPWTKPAPPKLWDVLEGIEMKGKKGDVSVEDLRKNNKYLMLYFSAHWCPPCRGFTPKFAEWYNDNHDKLAGTDNSFETIFVSSDRDQGAFDSYWAEQPWLALPFDMRDKKKEISELFDVKGIPSLVVIDTESGNTITKEGRAGVSSDASASEFPWPKKSIEFMSGDNVSPINDTPMFIAFTKGATDEETQRILNATKPVADEYMARSKAEEEDMEIEFRVDKGCDFTDRIKGLLPDLGDNTVVIVDISMKKAMIGFPKLAEINEAAVRTFCADFEDESKEGQMINLKM